MAEPETRGVIRHNFTDRMERVEYLRSIFPDAARLDPAVSPILGGRLAAEAVLSAIEPRRYAWSRNYLDGAVTRLSPYMRHGVLEPAEVRDVVLGRVGGDVEHKLIYEIAWRDYFQRVYRVLGVRIWTDIEPAKVESRGPRLDRLPDDIATGRTGLTCIDAFVTQLYATGYLHNHARMWLAAYVVHWRRVRWQAGAAWFLEHLLDGDPASNNLSWQWVASTFSHRPYLFNRENLERYSGGVVCQSCPVRGRCDFEGSYSELETRLFDMPAGRGRKPGTISLAPDDPLEVRIGEGGAVVWIHDDDLNPSGPSLASAPRAPAIHVWDDVALARQRLGLKRVVFLSECLADLPVEDRSGDPVSIVSQFARRHGADRVVTTESPDPRLAEVRNGIEATGLRVEVVRRRPFVRLDGVDLTRFSRYWSRASRALRDLSREQGSVGQAKAGEDEIPNLGHW